jgi:uncharacterized protein YfdQ (DUF2303 family)
MEEDTDTTIGVVIDSDTATVRTVINNDTEVHDVSAHNSNTKQQDRSACIQSHIQSRSSRAKQRHLVRMEYWNTLLTAQDEGGHLTELPPAPQLHTRL